MGKSATSTGARACSMRSRSVWQVTKPAATRRPTRRADLARVRQRLARAKLA
ncbi:MAG: hypothetical protein MZV64_34360 [Ignavibacteriales bacterium]|nr:hypothetical protein [Ignavibacteriales bacterium]